MSDPSDSQGVMLMIMCISLLVLCAGTLIGVTSYMAVKAKMRQKKTTDQHTPDMVSE